MNEVKLEKEKQEKLKIFSKVIYVIARIAKILSVIGVCFITLGVVVLTVVLANLKFDKVNHKIQIFDNTYDYVLTNKEISIDNNVIQSDVSDYAIKQIDKFIDMSNAKRITITILLSIGIVTIMIFMFMLFRSIEKIFINIHNNDTPFTLENVTYIRKIAFYLLLLLVVPYLIGSIIYLIYSLKLSIHIDLINLLSVLIAYSLSYIFEYGYQIQLDSKGKMYGDN